MTPKNDKLFNASLLALLAIYIILTQAAQFTGSVGIPLFDFQIDATPPAETSRYTIEILSTDGQAHTESMSLRQFVVEQEIREVGLATRLANQLGIAYFADDAPEVVTLRSELETLLFGEVGSAEYQLILRVINPVERYASGETVSQEVLTTFQFSSSVSAGQNALALIFQSP